MRFMAKVAIKVDIGVVVSKQYDAFVTNRVAVWQ
jgi:hypothetical protein